MALRNSGRFYRKEGRLEKRVRATGSFFRSSSPGNIAWLPLVVAIFLTSFATASAQEKRLPEFGAVSQVVQQSLATAENHEPQDLITRSQAAAALAAVERLGWKVPGQAQILEATLADDSFLAKQLSTPRGKRFMRKIAKYPGTYSRLDQLSSIARGHQIVRDLVDAKDGDLMIVYMATTKGGANLGQMMGSARQGVDLNKPTGRIYTGAELLALLAQLHTAELQQGTTGP